MKIPIYRLILVVGVLGLLVACNGVQASGVVPESEASVTLTPSALADALELGPEVSTDMVARLHGEGVTIIDVREAWEYAEGHIPGAKLMPLGTLSSRVNEIPTDHPVILVCRSDNRSGQAMRFLQQQGLENVHNMTGGMIAWEGDGRDIER